MRYLVATLFALLVLATPASAYDISWKPEKPLDGVASASAKGKLHVAQFSRDACNGEGGIQTRYLGAKWSAFKDLSCQKGSVRFGNPAVAIDAKSGQMFVAWHQKSPRHRTQLCEVRDRFHSCRTVESHRSSLRARRRSLD